MGKKLMVRGESGSALTTVGKIGLALVLCGIGVVALPFLLTTGIFAGLMGVAFVATLFGIFLTLFKWALIIGIPLFVLAMIFGDD